jgi:predicted TIM-barrel fold metal-dependent hydrolase
LKVVDADAHVNPPTEMWAEYLPEHLRPLAPRIEHGEDADYVVFEGRRKKVSLIGGAGGANKDYKISGRVSDMKAGGWMPEARLQDMDKDGIDAAVLFGGGPLGTTNRELFVESFSAYNRWLVDFCNYAPDRLTPVGYVSSYEVEDTVEQIKRCAALGCTAINLPAFPQSLSKAGETAPSEMQLLALTGDPNGDRSYGTPEFDPIWKTVCDLGLTVTIHLGARSTRIHMPDKFLSDIPMSKIAMAEPIAVLIYGGVFDRFPDLKFVTVESGVGWFAWFAEYMDRTWARQRFWVNNKTENTPSYYMDRNVYGSFIRDVTGVRNRHLPGAGNIMWSSDYPHSETTFPNSQADIELHFDGVSAEDKHMIICERARKLFRVGEMHRASVTV